MRIHLDLKPHFSETSSFYIYRTQVITEMGRHIGKYLHIVEVGKIGEIDINEEEEFVMTDAVYNYYFQLREGITGKRIIKKDWRILAVFPLGEVA